MVEERSCKACRSKFIPNAHNQIYCSECRRNPQKAHMSYVQRQQKYRDILGETADRRVAYTCIQCGHTGLSKFARDFCSDTCRHVYLDAHIVCAACGCNLAELGIHFNKRIGRPVFCSDECRKAYEWKVAREKGLVDICLHCGQEFIVKIRKTHGGYCEHRSQFCSQGCRHSYQKQHTQK